jgi:hypothetical protein
MYVDLRMLYQPQRSVPNVMMRKIMDVKWEKLGRKWPWTRMEGLKKITKKEGNSARIAGFLV